MRVVIISMAAEAVESYVQLLQALGHDTVGVLTMKNKRRPEAVPEVIERTPAGVDTVVVGSKDRVAPLLRSYEPDLGLCGGWGWKLDAEVLSVPSLGIVNGHPSLLPRWRGGNPFGWTFRSGDPELGFTFHLMDEELDTGPILAQGSVPLSDEDTMASLLDHMRELGASLLPKALARIEAGDRGDPQPEEGVTYAPRFEDDYAEIDWTKPAREVHNQVRSWFVPSVSGIIGPLTTLDGKRVRVLDSRIVDSGSDAPPGTIVERDADGLLVQCADTLIRVARWEPASEDTS